MYMLNDDEPGRRIRIHRSLPRSFRGSSFMVTYKAWQPALNSFQCRTLVPLIL